MPYYEGGSDAFTDRSSRPLLCRSTLTETTVRKMYSLRKQRSGHTTRPYTHSCKRTAKLHGHIMTMLCVYIQHLAETLQRYAARRLNNVLTRYTWTALETMSKKRLNR